MRACGQASVGGQHHLFPKSCWQLILSQIRMICVSSSASLLQDIETDGPSATVPGIVVGVEPRPAFAQRWRKENNKWIKKTQQVGINTGNAKRPCGRGIFRWLIRGMRFGDVYSASLGATALTSLPPNTHRLRKVASGSTWH